MDPLYERCRDLILRSQATRRVAEAARSRVPAGAEDYGEQRLIELDDMSYDSWTPPRREKR